MPQSRKEVIRKLWWGREPFDGFPARLYAIDHQGWASSHRYLGEAINEVQPSIVVEIGVWKGASTMTMASRMRDLSLDGVVIAVDTWLGSREHWMNQEWFAHLDFVYGQPMISRTFMSNIVNAGLADFVVPLPIDSLNACAVLKQHGFKPDVIHLDGSHEYEAVIADLNAWWPLLNERGIFIGDDYVTDGNWPGVRKAFDEFFESRGLMPFEFADGKCRIRKPAGSVNPKKTIGSPRSRGESAIAQIPTDLPAAFFPAATLKLDTKGLPFAEPRQGSFQPQSREISLVIRDPLLQHYFHFMEMMVGISVLENEFMVPQAKIKEIYVGAGILDNPRQNHVQRQLFEILYPDAQIVESFAGERHVENVVSIERRSAVTLLNKLLEPFWPMAVKSAPQLRYKVFNALGLSPPRVRPSRTRPQALYVHRDPPRALTQPAQNRLFKELKACGLQVETIDYAKLTWQEQVCATHEADILVGVHGNGLTNLIWLPDDAFVLELFPRGVHHYDYQIMAELFGMEYCGIEAVERDGFVARDFSRFGPAVHGRHDLLRIFPWELMSEWLTRALARRIGGSPPA